MPLPMQEVLSVLAILADNEQIKVNVKEYLKGGVIAGSCTAVGGALGGPVGMALGGAIGGGLAGWLASGKCVPLSAVIRDMNDAYKQKLYAAAMACITKFDITDIATLKMLVVGAATPELTTMLIGALRDFAASNYELAA